MWCWNVMCEMLMKRMMKMLSNGVVVLVLLCGGVVCVLCWCVG